MASFADKIPQFNPYVEQLPVEAMVKVGMEKQRRYDEGIQKIQSHIDQVAGIELLRDGDKKYLQSKLGELESKIKTVAAGDFSNYQLVNSVSGMTNQIAKDPIISAGVQSTAWYKKQKEIMDAERKKGNLTPDNLYNFNKGFQNYLNSGLTDEDGNPVTFSGSYVPHFDVFKYAKETFDAIKPDGLTWEQVYETDANGNPKIDPVTKQPVYSPIMIRKEQEGISTDKVKQTLSQIFSDPRVSQQLQISGEYSYAGLTANDLVGRLSVQRDATMSALKSRLDELTIQKNLGKDVQNDIDIVKSNITKLDDNYQAMREVAIYNPDKMRGLLYKQEVGDKYTTMFSSMKTKTTTHDNPGWNANFKLMQEANEQSRFAQRLKFDKDVHADTIYWKEKDYEQRERLAELKAAGKKVGASLSDWEISGMPSDYDYMEKFENDYSSASAAYTSSANSLVWSTVLSSQPEIAQQFSDLMKLYNNKDQVISKIISSSAAKAGQSVEEYTATLITKATTEMNNPGAKITADIRDAQNNYNRAKVQYDDMVNLKSKIDQSTYAQINSTLSKVSPEAQTVKLLGREFDLSKDDANDLAVYMASLYTGAGWFVDDAIKRAGKAAERRLEQRGLKSIVDNHRRLLEENQIPKIGSAAVELARGNYAEVLKTKAKIVKDTYVVPPSLKTAIATGNTEEDTRRMAKIKNLAGNYKTSKQNISGDFDDFVSELGKDLKDTNIETVVRTTPSGQQQIELVMYTDGKRKGGMTISPEEANNIGIDVSSVYEPREVTIMKNSMAMKGGKTSEGDPKDVNTYIQGDVRLTKGDLPGMSGDKEHDVKVNFINENGVYYACYYVSKGNTKKVVVSQPSASLSQIYQNVIQNTTPTWVGAMLKQ